MKLQPPLEMLIPTLRQQKVILDGVPTKIFSEAVKRNQERFPEDFRFQLTAKEWAGLRSQIATPDPEHTAPQCLTPNWSQFVTSSKRPRGAAYRPYAVTEHGAIKAATVLNSAEAVTMSLYVVRAFIRMREDLTANAAILKRLAEIDKPLLLHDTALRDIYQKFLPLLAPEPPPPKRQIGFHVKEEPAPATKPKNRFTGSRCPMQFHPPGISPYPQTMDERHQLASDASRRIPSAVLNGVSKRNL
jgi:hypothetical protein